MILAASVTLQSKTLLPEDQVVTTWHFNCTTDASLGALAVATRLTEFYNNIPTSGTSRPCSFIPASISTTGGFIKVYDLSEPMPRPPLVEVPLTLFSAGGAGYPTETCVCLSYQAGKVPGVPQARRRGRIYFGPLTVATGTADTQDQVRPSAALRNTLALAATDLMNKNDDVSWVVYSRVLGTAATIEDGWVDNAFDTQRRRGIDRTARTVWP